VAVFGVAHPRRVETVAAVVIPKPGASLTEEAVIRHAWAAGGLQDAKRVVIADAIPKDPGEKILKRQPREEHKDLAAGAWCRKPGSAACARADARHQDAVPSRSQSQRQAQNAHIWRRTRLADESARATHNGGSARAYWPSYRVVSVPAIMSIHGTTASASWISMQTIVSQERAHMPHRVRARSGGIWPTSARPFDSSSAAATGRPAEGGPETSPLHGSTVGAGYANV